MDDTANPYCLQAIASQVIGYSIARCIPPTEVLTFSWRHRDFWRIVPQLDKHYHHHVLVVLEQWELLQLAGATVDADDLYRLCCEELRDGSAGKR